VHIWDLRTESVVGTICGPKICGDTIDIKGQYILTGAYRSRDQLQLWDLGTQKLVQTLAWTDSSEVPNRFIPVIKCLYLWMSIQQD
jgi:hypothetical protein